MGLCPARALIDLAKKDAPASLIIFPAGVQSPLRSAAAAHSSGRPRSRHDARPRPQCAPPGPVPCYKHRATGRSEPVTIRNGSLGSLGAGRGTIDRRPRGERFRQLKRELGEARAKEATASLNNLQLRAELQTSTEERDEARRQQTATADVLKVISRSQVDLQAVFETVVDLAAQLCRAERATILRLNGDCFTLVASYGMPADYSESVQTNPVRLDRGSLSGRAALDGRPVHVPDVLADPEFARHENSKSSVASEALSRHR